MKTWILILACCALLCLYVGYKLGRTKPKVVQIEAPMSVQQTQLKLKELGYDIKADNIWGPETEKAYCNYMAMKVWPLEGEPE